MQLINKKQVISIVLFVLMGFAALQVPVARLIGSRATFTLFDAFAPIAGAFLGSFPGVITVFLMQFLNFLIKGAHFEDMGTFIRFVPMLFAVLYFAKGRTFNLAIPLIAILAFNIHPIGRSVWYFSLYWFVPIICYFFQTRSLLARSLGATFTAHAVGGALWIYFFNLPKSVWIGLIPVVALERIFFALGITVMYVLLTNVIYILEKRWSQLGQLHLDKKYVWRRVKVMMG